MPRRYLFTSESVTEGHPDKLADRISDAVLDGILASDPYGRVACETFVTTGVVMVAGEISTDTYVDVPTIVRNEVKSVGYTRAKFGFDAETCGVITSIQEQSPDIAQGVDTALEQYDVVPLDDSQAFIQFYARNLQRKSYVDLSVCAKIIQSCIARKRGRILTARNRKGELVAANFCAWDAKSSYYLMSTRADNSGNGAGSLLLWKAILDATSRQLVFDMDGLASEGGILFFAGFGAEVRPRYVAERFTALGHIRRAFHAMRDPLRMKLTAK